MTSPDLLLDDDQPALFALDGLETRPAWLVARGLGVAGSRGPAYADLRLDLAAGDLHAVQGPAGSGRSTLLLTLAGRLARTSGEVLADGREVDAADLRRLAVVAHVAGVDDLDPTLTVRDHLRERRWATGRDGRADLVAHLAPRTLVRDLGGHDRLLLHLALALPERGAGQPRLLVVDDLDRGLGPAHQHDVWTLLRELADDGLTVVGSCIDATAAGHLPHARTTLEEHR